MRLYLVLVHILCSIGLVHKIDTEGEKSGCGPGPWVEESGGQLLEKRDYLKLTCREIEEKLNSHCGPGGDIDAKNEVSSLGHQVLRIMECL